MAQMKRKFMHNDWTEADAEDLSSEQKTTVDRIELLSNKLGRVLDRDAERHNDGTAFIAIHALANVLGIAILEGTQDPLAMARMWGDRIVKIISVNLERQAEQATKQ
jgi:hypothetical protein